MAILQVENLTKRFGDVVLFQNLNFIINKGEKVAIVAKNGAGKTTLISLIVGKDTPQEGIIYMHPNTVIGYLEQNPELDSTKTIYDEVYYSNSFIVELIEKYATAISCNDTVTIDKLSNELDVHNVWEYENQVSLYLSKLGFQDTSTVISKLSGGQKKRVALAKILLKNPDFLILDEPTNHLDLDVIEWLEDTLDSLQCTVLMVTHDRYFLDRVCNTIIEIDDKQAFKYTGNYSYFLEKKEERQILMTTEIAKAKNLMRTELEWIRRQPKARGTKAKYRIDAFGDLKQKASKTITNKKLDITLQGSRLGNKVIELHGISKSYDSHRIIENFSYLFHKKEKLAIIGPNGCGKTTFLQLITNQLQPDSGYVEYGETVVVGYYKQDGLLLHEDCKVIEVIQNISETIEIENGNTISAAQFLEQWLFPRNMHYMYVSRLSGGEKKRLYLMTVLMKKPNVLILDEPTNDLDLFTLQILEEFLVQFMGCVIIVSHDRFFTDKLVEHLFVFKGNGIIEDFPGNYTQFKIYERLQEDSIQKSEKIELQKPKAEKVIKGLTYKEKIELELIEKELEQLEQEKKIIEQELIVGTLSNAELIVKSERIGEIIQLIELKEIRWLELQEKL